MLHICYAFLLFFAPEFYYSFCIINEALVSMRAWCLLKTVKFLSSILNKNIFKTQKIFLTFFCWVDLKVFLYTKKNFFEIFRNSYSSQPSFFAHFRSVFSSKIFIFPTIDRKLVAVILILSWKIRWGKQIILRDKGEKRLRVDAPAPRELNLTRQHWVKVTHFVLLTFAHFGVFWQIIWAWEISAA